MATKTRRPVVMATPPPATSKDRPTFTHEQKQSLLDNFDLEVEDKTRAFRSSLAATLHSFMMRQETEILKIPRELRKMTLADLEAKWGGSWSGTLQRITRDKIDEREKEEVAAREKAEAEEMKGKRKRGAVNTPDGSPRTAKNARKEGVSASSRKPLRPSTAANASARRTTKIPQSRASSTTSKGPSALPQNHIFNPALPPTPSFPRQARRNESFFSANGSPLAIPSSSVASTHRDHSDPDFDNDHYDDDDQSDNDHGAQSDDSDELPDPEALEAKILAKTTSSPKSKPSKPSRPSKPSSSSSLKRGKRAPSLMFRQSIAPGEGIPRSGPNGESDVVMASIPLSDGRLVTFDPLNLTPRRIDDEMDEGGLGKDEKEMVTQRVRDEVVKALAAKMEKWKVV